MENRVIVCGLLSSNKRKSSCFRFPTGIALRIAYYHAHFHQVYLHLKRLYFFVSTHFRNSGSGCLWSCARAFAGRRGLRLCRCQSGPDHGIKNKEATDSHDESVAPPLLAIHDGRWRWCHGNFVWLARLFRSRTLKEVCLGAIRPDTAYWTNRTSESSAQLAASPERLPNLRMLEDGPDERIRAQQGLEASPWAYSIFFPNADSASSTASSAVWLRSSSTGFTSTISKLNMRPWSAMISIARCPSR